MNITIVGAGNVGTQIAVHAAAKGHAVTIFSQRWKEFSDDLSIVDDTGSVILEGQIKAATDDPYVAFGNADLLIITLPSFCHKEFADKYIGYARKGMAIGFFPGTGACEYAFNGWLEKGVVIFGVQRVPSVARLIQYGHTVRAIGYRNKLYLAALPHASTDLYCGFVSSLFGISCGALPNYLSVTLTPSNAILHTTRLYCLFKDYRKGITEYESIPLFYEDWDLTSAEMLLKCDDEVQHICQAFKAYDIDLSSVKSLRDHYESKDAIALRNKIASIQSFKGLGTPSVKLDNGKYIPDFNSRYFTADFPYGLRIIQEVGNIIGIDTPFIDIIWNWYILNCNQSVFFAFSDYGINDINTLIMYYKRGGGLLIDLIARLIIFSICECYFQCLHHSYSVSILQENY